MTTRCLTGVFVEAYSLGPQDAANGLQIELPYEQVGQVTVTGTRRLLATQILMSLAGSGPAPF